MSAETSQPVTSRPDREFAPIAHPLHTIVLLVVLAVWAYFGKIRADNLRDTVDVNRAYLYVRTMLFEWLLVGFIVWGVRRKGAAVSAVSAVFGERWKSLSDVARDFGIGFVFVFVSIAISAIFGPHGGPSDNHAVSYLLPRTVLEMVLWVALSVTAGICEEVINRGYLQRQFAAWTGSAALGIVLQAIVFGAGHAYQGLARVIPIAVLGLALGGLAQWRKSVRPGMFEHAIQDSLGLFIRR